MIPSEPDLPPTRVLAWTGHRHLRDRNLISAAVAKAVERLDSESRRDGGRVVGIGSVAIGSDVLVCEALRARDIPFSVVLPFDLDRFETGADHHDQQRIRSLCEHARSLRVVTPQESDDLAYLVASESMLELADVLLAIVDEDHSPSAAGALAIADLATRLGLPVIRIDAITGRIDWPADGLSRPSFRQSAGENQPDLTRCLASRADVERFRRKLDHDARRQARSVRMALSQAILWHLAAVGVAVVGLLASHGEDTHVPWIPWGVAVFKSLALLWALFLVRRNHLRHLRWLRSRVNSEMCRSFLAIWDMPRSAIVLAPAPIESSRPLHRELCLVWLLDRPEPLELEEAKRRYLGWSGGPGRITSQIRYFRERMRPARRWSRVLISLSGTSTLLALLASLAVCAFLALDLHGPVMSWVKGASILLPLVSAAAMTWVTSSDLVRRADRYAELADRLEGLRTRGEAARSWHSLARVVSDTEWILLAEIGEWRSFARYASGLH